MARKDVSARHHTLKDSNLKVLALPFFVFAVHSTRKRELCLADLPFAHDSTTIMKKLLADYNSKENISLADIIEFRVQFERIHPFQDGNGRIGRRIMFKECLEYNIVPFIIEDRMKMFYYRGL